jgi:two-component system, LytTR family, sensor kinase
VIAHRHRAWWVASWVAVVLLFAVQWFAYDAARGNTDRFYHYLWWSFYTWGVLTPIVVTLALRHPIDGASWKRALPLHLAASLVIVGLEISAEVLIGKLYTHRDALLLDVVKHYFGRHAQVSMFTYWLIVGAVQLHHMRDAARRRELRASRLEAELNAAQLEMLRAQLHPHFLFNTLQAATTLVHDDPDAAEDILVRLSELLRVSMDEVHVQEVPLKRELELIELYMGIQVRRFGDRLQFVVSIGLDVRECMVPALILQPLVENAIGHGIARHKRKDTVTIRGARDGSSLRLEVRNLSGTLEPGGTRPHGIGLANTRARLEQLYGEQQILELRNLLPSGVSTEIVLPWRQAHS